MRTRVVIPIAAALLSACTMGPNYTKPEIDTPQAFQYEPKDAADTADTEWWKQQPPITS